MVVGGAGAGPLFDEETRELYEVTASDANSAPVADEELPLPVVDFFLNDVDDHLNAKEGAGEKCPSDQQKPQNNNDDNNNDLLEGNFADFVRYSDDKELVNFVSEMESQIKFQRRNVRNAPMHSGVIRKVRPHRV